MHTVEILWTSDQHNKQQTHETNIMPSAEFEPAIPEIERPQTYALQRTATGIGTKYG
jgi:hypothetical protein